MQGRRSELVPSKNGGVSFLLIPVAERTYNFWVHICPLSAGFSHKGAIAKLRAAVANNVMPWGVLELDDRPLLDQVLDAAAKTDLPTELSNLLIVIRHQNEREEKKLQYAIQQARAIIQEYANN